MSIPNFLYSQVFNFGGPNQDGVDFRTGLYWRNLELYQAPSEALNCPSLQLSLRYNPLLRHDIGFGQGWEFNLSSYSRASNTLTLSTGEHFQVAEAGSSATVVDQKLKSFHLKKKGSDYHLIHKNGRVEILSHNNNIFNEAVPIELHAPNGSSLQLAWTQVKGQTRLQTIQEKSRVLLQIEYTASKTEVIRAPGTIETSTLTLIQNSAKLLDQIQLPSEEGFWSLTYAKLGEITCLIKVRNPAGLIEEMQYHEKGHRMPNKGPYQYLPYITQHTLRPGNLQPPIVTKYSYSDQNFLAYKGLWDWKQGEDNLYRAANTYQYSVSTQMLGGRQTKYIYNKFHLLIGIRQQQGKNSISTDIEYHALKDASFQHQPAAYQLPKRIRTAYLNADGSSRTETKQYAFDDWGNLVQKIKPSGIRIDYTYFPAGGEKSFCPADPNGFQQYLKSVKITPALIVTHISDLKQAPIRHITYKYCELPTLNKAVVGYYVAVHEIQRLDDNYPLIGVRNTYVIGKDKADHHGRLQQQAVQLKGKYETIYTWKYSNLSTNLLKKTTQIATYDHHTMQSNTILSTNTGYTISQTSKNEIEQHTQYDKIGRITLHMVSPGKKPYEAVMKNEYTVTEGASGYTITTTDFQGLQIRHHTDGLGRICRIERQDDSDGMLGPFRVIQERKYNHLGQLIAVNSIDWLKAGDKRIKERNEQKFDYDDWGYLSKLTDSSGAVILAKSNPVSRTHIEGLQGEGQIRVEFNRFGAISQKLLIKSDGKSYKKVDYTYDGLGRLVEETNNSESTTAYQLDAFDRLVQTTYPNGRTIFIQYAAHSTSILPVSTRVDDCTVGTQSFDGSCRITSQTLGTRTTSMAYKENEPNPAAIQTPQGDKLEFSYDPALSYAVTSVKCKDQLEIYQYDRRSSALMAFRGSSGAELREYLPSGLLVKEKTQIDRKKQFSAQSTYSMASKLRTYTDVHGQKLEIQYDQLGRPKQVVQGGSRTTFAYDQSNRLSERCYDDGKKKSLKTSLKYDDFGREVDRIIHAGNALLYRLEQTFNDMSLLTNRTIKSGKDELLREENFEYDQQGRLIDYKYRGAQPMIDEAGQKISRQQFSFDKYDNLVKIVNTFEDGSQNTRKYLYTTEDPTQLTKISNTHKNYARKVALEYNKNGCLIRDEQGRRLKYDTKGRLSMIFDTKDEVLSQYYYDASGRLVCQKAGLLNTYLHYRGNKLVAMTSGDQNINSHQSVLAWCDTQKPDSIKQQQYMPYGYGTADFVGFNGQWRDPITGWYHLGNGCRVYNPVLMRFHSPDQRSPFLSGDINAYAYCLNDPVNRVDPVNCVDPTGHVSIFGTDDSRGNNSFLSQSLGPLQVPFREGPLLNGPGGQPPWTDQVAYFDSIDGVPDLQGFMTHGDTSGRLLGWRNTFQNGTTVEGLWGDTATNVAQDTILPTIQHNIDNKAGFFSQRLGKPIYLFSCNGADPIPFGGQQLVPIGQRVADALNRAVVAFHGELNVLPEFRSANIGMIHNVLETNGGPKSPQSG
ncbi:hypothetical protein HDV63DRAFT_413076 [Trichoderma sp. SZMC 28014]